MGLYKYATSEVLRFILKGQIRFSQPGAFNDPFELLPEIDHPLGVEIVAKKLSFSLLAPRLNNPEFDLPETHESQFCNDLVSRQIVDYLNEIIGVLCLTKNPQSLSMWAHYADDYRGGLIEFDEKHEFFSNSVKVDYSAVRPKKSVLLYIKDDQPIPIAELCTKSEEWANEKEVRIFRSLEDCIKVKEVNGKYPICTQEIPLAAIKSVKLGERMPAPEMRKVWDILKKTNIPISIATIAISGYAFDDEFLKSAAPIPEGGPVINARTAELFKDDVGPTGLCAQFMLKNSPRRVITKR